MKGVGLAVSWRCLVLVRRRSGSTAPGALTKPRAITGPERQGGFGDEHPKPGAVGPLRHPIGPRAITRSGDEADEGCAAERRRREGGESNSRPRKTDDASVSRPERARLLQSAPLVGGAPRTSPFEPRAITRRETSGARCRPRRRSRSERPSHRDQRWSTAMGLFSQRGLALSSFC